MADLPLAGIPSAAVEGSIVIDGRDPKHRRLATSQVRPASVVHRGPPAWWHDLALPWGFGVGVAPAAVGYAAASRRPLKRLRMSIAALWTLVPGP